MTSISLSFGLILGLKLITLPFHNPQDGREIMPLIMLFSILGLIIHFKLKKFDTFVIVNQ
jgi:hypothetical protein